MRPLTVTKFEAQKVFVSWIQVTMNDNKCNKQKNLANANVYAKFFYLKTFEINQRRSSFVFIIFMFQLLLILTNISFFRHCTHAHKTQKTHTHTIYQQIHILQDCDFA